MAEDVTLWDSQTFMSASFSGSNIVSSAEINNNNDLNAAKVTITYEAIEPDGKDNIVGFLIQAVLEEEVAPNVWVPIATQDDQIKGTDEPLQQVIDLAPQTLIDPGTVLKVSLGSNNEIAISKHDGRAPGKMRVCLLHHCIDDTKPQLDSVTLSGFLRKYDK